MRLRTRYLISLVTLVAVMTVPALYGIGRVLDMRTIALDLRHQAAGTAIAAGRLSRAIAELDRYQRTYVATADPEVGIRVDRTIGSIEDQLDLLTRLGSEDITAAVAPVVALRTATDSLRSLVAASAMEDATSHLSLVTQPLLVDIDEALVDLSAAIERKTAARVAEAEQIAASAVAATATAILLSLLAAGVLAFVAARLLTRPLERLSAAMGTVAAGRLESTVDPAQERSDEVGDLFRSFHAMTSHLIDLDRMKAELVGTASHDLKTPISVITGYVEFMEEASGSLEGHHRQMLHSLREQSRALGARVDQLVEISRMEARGLHLGLEEINIRHFATGVESALAPLAQSHGVELAVSVSRDAPTFIVADPDCLRVDIVANVASHSIKFAPRGSVVRVEFSGSGGHLHLEIHDQGPPVPPEHVEHIFDRYFRGVSGSGRIGSGLGLPIARAGVETHGGTISVRSDEAGTEFTIDLPLRPGAVQPRGHQIARLT